MKVRGRRKEQGRRAGGCRREGNESREKGKGGSLTPSTMPAPTCCLSGFSYVADATPAGVAPTQSPARIALLFLAPLRTPPKKRKRPLWRVE